MEVLVTISWLGIIGLAIWKLPFFSKFGLKRKTVLIIYLLHVAAGVALSLIYTIIYPQRNLADTFKYFDDSVHIYNLLWESPADFVRMITGYHCDNIHLKPVYDKMYNWYVLKTKYLYNDNRTMIRINAVMMIFSGGFYYVHILFFCMMSLLGKLFIFKAFQNLFQDKKNLLFIAIFLIPSVLFWSAGILKEGFLFLLMGLFICGFERWSDQPKSLKYLSLILLTLFGLFFVKFYVAIALLPGLFSVFWIKQKAYRKPFLKTTIVHLSFVAAAVAFHIISPFHSFLNGLQWQKRSFYGLAESMNSGSVVHTMELHDNFLSFFSNVPEGLFNAFFRPFIWDALHPFSPVVMASALENILFLAVFILTIIWFKKPDSKNAAYIFFFASFTLILFTLSGVVTPIIGTLVRYKMPALPFMLMMCFLLWDKSRYEKTKLCGFIDSMVL
ncbi:MAG: hypothetical protein NT150_04170 [Bacteroidetes bacterium]|nr:hypothetical protein [Bacteroidota bacterium]